MLRDNNYIKATKKYLIKYFAFYYNSACKVYKDAKYSVNVTDLQWGVISVRAKRIFKTIYLTKLYITTI